MSFTLSALKEQCASALQRLYSDREIDSLFRLLCEDVLAISRITLLTEPDAAVSDSKAQSFKSAVDALGTGKPYQYISGKASFRNLELTVSEAVLIPRPETEELVQLFLDDAQSVERVLDIGTGSGCIALSISEELPSAEVHGLDVSESALSLAKDNARKYGLTTSFHLLSMEDDLTRLGQFSTVISNPPYIGMEELGGMERNVTEFEPHLALFSKTADPLYFYKVIRKQLDDILQPGGKLYLECHEDYAKETTALFEGNGFTDVRIINDLQGKQRFVTLVKV